MAIQNLGAMPRKAPTVVFIYYLCMVDMRWSRRLLVAGIVTQVPLLIATFTLLTFTDGGFLVAPLLLVGPVAWLVYVLRLRDAKQIG